MEIELSHIQDGTSGDWEVKTFVVSKEDESITRMRAAIQFHRELGRGIVPAGTYKYLKRKGATIMINTPDEIDDARQFIEISAGNILINGLGLGVVLTAILAKKNVKKVTVIEKSEDVIKLISPSFKDERLIIIHADAFEYQPPKGEKYDYVWHDIWDNICSDNLPEMAKLHRKYARKTKWQDSWCKIECLRNR